VQPTTQQFGRQDRGGALPTRQNAPAGGDDVRIVEGLFELVQPVGFGRCVVVDESHQVTGRGRDAGVARRGHAAPRAQNQLDVARLDRAQLLEQRRVGVDHHDDFVRIVGTQTLDALEEQCEPPVGVRTHHHRNRSCRHANPRRRALSHLTLPPVAVVRSRCSRCD